MLLPGKDTGIKSLQIPINFFSVGLPYGVLFACIFNSFAIGILFGVILFRNVCSTMILANLDYGKGVFFQMIVKDENNVVARFEAMKEKISPWLHHIFYIISKSTISCFG